MKVTIDYSIISGTFHCILLPVSIPFQDSRGSYPDLGPDAEHIASSVGGARGERERVDQVPPKEQRELQLKTGMVAKDKLEANLTTHPHNAVLCEQLSLT